MWKLIAGNAQQSMLVLEDLHDTRKTYRIQTRHMNTYNGKIHYNNNSREILELDTDDADEKWNNDVKINYSDITRIWEYVGSGGGKRINYSTKKSKNRRHASRRRRTTKKHSGRIKHSRRRRA